MQFLKKHYEKVILSIVLLGLAVAAAALPIQVSHVKDYLDQMVSGFVKAAPKPFKPLDLSTNRAVVAKLRGPIDLELSGSHNVFNPVTWKKMPSGQVIKLMTGNEVGPNALVVSNINELKLVVAFEGVTPPRYQFSVLRETDNKPARVQRSITAGTRGDLFELLKVEGPPDNPTSALLKFKDMNEPITVLRDKPFEKIIGYSADLVYPPEKQNLPRKRKKDTFKLEGETETYNIVVIESDKVVVSAKSTQKRTILRLNPRPAGNATEKQPTSPQ